MYWGLACETAAFFLAGWGLHQAAKLFRPLTSASTPLGPLEGLKAPTPPRRDVLRLMRSGVDKTRAEWAQGETEKDLGRLANYAKQIQDFQEHALRQIHEAHVNAITDLHAKVREFAVGDLSWGYIALMLALSGMIFTTLNDKLVTWFG